MNLDMKKLVLIATSFLLIACGEKSTDDLIKDKNITELKNRKAAIQSELEKIDAALVNGNKTPESEALVSVVTIKDTVFNHYLEVQGNVNTKENILVQPEFSGTLTTLNVKAGQRVAKGQILGKVDDAGMSQQLASIENQYALAKTTFERQKNLWDKKIGSEIQFLQAQAQMISAQKSVAQMRAQVAKTVIRAPFSGTIDEVFVERGQVVAPSPQGLMRIVNLSNMYVSTTVPETYIGKLKPGTEVDVFLTSLGKTYKGKVRQVANFINPSNRSFGIEVSVPNPDNLLRPNQVAKLKIIDYTTNNAIVVPTNVVQEDGEHNKFVFIATNVNGKSGVAKKVLVKVGKSSNNVTEILSGLAANDVIITEGVNNIADGMKLNF
jgi:membrane fusion protein, multidrug efflux system